jgi:serine/threonine-protein kinase
MDRDTAKVDRRTWRRLVELNPGAMVSNGAYGLALMSLGRYSEALEAIEKESLDFWRLQNIAMLRWAMGDKSKSNDALQQLQQKYSADAAYNIADIFAFRGEFDSAFEWLERAFQQHDTGTSHLNGDPYFAKVRTDPRFHSLIVRMKLDRDI